MRQLDSAEASGDPAAANRWRQTFTQCLSMMRPETPAQQVAESKARRQDVADRERAAGGADQLNEEVGVSGAVCAYTYLRATAMKEIEAEKKYARDGAGVVDTRKLYILQSQMRLADEGLARILPVAHLLPCDGEVRSVAECVLSVKLNGVIPPGVCQLKTSMWAYQR